MNVSPLARRLWSEGSERLMWAAHELGYQMEPMPKFVDPEKCEKCGNCVLGCPKGAKWTALEYLEEAGGNRAEVLYETTVQQVLVEKGKARGIRTFGPQGEIDILSDVVVLSAGGLGSPVILQHSGIDDAGPGLFIDLLVNTYGVTDGLNQRREPSMALVSHEFHKSRGFILSPYVNHPKMTRFMESGARGMALPGRRLNRDHDQDRG